VARAKTQSEKRRQFLEFLMLRAAVLRKKELTLHIKFAGTANCCAVARCAKRGNPSGLANNKTTYK
jgi:hypothetical protein